MSLSQVQALAAQTLAAVAAGRNLSDHLAETLAAHPELSAPDKGMLQDLAYGCQRHLGSLRHMLGRMLDKPIKQPDLEHHLLVALYQLAHTQNAPHAVVNEAVSHIGRIGRGQYRSFANAVLRRFLRERDKLAAACKHDETARHNMPAWFSGSLKAQYPDHWHNIITALQSRPPLTLRINRRLSNAEDYLHKLRACGLDGKILGSHALRLARPVPVAQLPHFDTGMVSVQDYGAQQAAPLLNPQAGERILDACAAPGGKSGHLLELADCELTALDIDPVRLERVKSNLARLGFQAAVQSAAAQDLAAWYDGRPFDAILADVPCTASGTIKRNPDIKWLRRPGDAVKTARQQEPLLDALWSVLKPGGRMLLATCSLFEAENQQQTRRFLARHANARLREEQLLLPNDRQDGFYYALFEKHPLPT